MSVKTLPMVFPDLLFSGSTSQCAAADDAAVPPAGPRPVGEAAAPASSAAAPPPASHETFPRERHAPRYTRAAERAVTHKRFQQLPYRWVSPWPQRSADAGGRWPVSPPLASWCRPLRRTVQALWLVPASPRASRSPCFQKGSLHPRKLYYFKNSLLIYSGLEYRRSYSPAPGDFLIGYEGERVVSNHMPETVEPRCLGAQLGSMASVVSAPVFVIMA